MVCKLDHVNAENARPKFETLYTNIKVMFTGTRQVTKAKYMFCTWKFIIFFFSCENTRSIPPIKIVDISVKVQSCQSPQSLPSVEIMYR